MAKAQTDDRNFAPGISNPVGFARFVRRLGKSPYDTVMDLHRQHGEVASVSAGTGQALVFLFGREANSFVLSQHKELFRFREAYKSLIPVDGETALIVSDGEEHTRRRRLVQPAFRPHSIDGYVEMMAEDADEVVRALEPGTEVDLYEAFRAGVRRAVIRALFGEHLYAHADEIGETLEPALEFVNLPPQKQIKVNVVGSRYYQAVRARALTDKIIDAEVDRRLSMEPGSRPENDVMAMLLAGEDGETLSREELRDQIVSLIAAGYDTTSAVLGWAIHILLTRPAIWTTAADEIESAAGNAPLTIDAINEMTYLNGIVHEALRLYPPGVVAPRYAVADFSFGGFDIAKGSMVFYSPYVTQRDPELWPQPDEFLPSRWDSDALNYSQPAPYSFITFGGGSRRCIGFAFATLEMKIFLAELIRRTTLEPAYDGKRKAEGIASVRPGGGVPAKVISVR